MALAGPALQSNVRNPGPPECTRQETSTSELFGSVSMADPECIIAGKTHMLAWKSPQPAKIIVVCIHGLGLCARAYKPLALQLSKDGIDGFAVNVRGFGPDRDKPDLAKLNCRQTVDDVCRLLTGIAGKHPDYKVVLSGESMGGALAITIAAEHPQLVDKIICSAPAWKLLKLRRTAAKGIVELVLFPRSRPGPAGLSVMRQASSDPVLLEHWQEDPAHKLKLSPGEAAAFLRFVSKTDRYARQLQMPVLMIQGLNDRLVSPAGAARLFKDIPCHDKTFLIDARAEHLILEEGRFTTPLVERLITWIKAEQVSTGKAVEIVNDSHLSSVARSKLGKLYKILDNPKLQK